MMMLIMTLFMMSMNDHSNEDDDEVDKKASYPAIGESVRAAMRKAVD